MTFNSKKGKIVFYFYKKIALQALLIAFGLIAVFMVKTEINILKNLFQLFAISLAVLHFAVYEISNPNAYVFYNNLGLTKQHFRIITVSICFILFVFGFVF